MLEIVIESNKFNFNLKIGSDAEKGLTSAGVSDTASLPETNQLAILAQQIQAVYTFSELRQASRFLDVKFENLPGNTLFDKAYGLVVYFYSRNINARLSSYLASDRPHIHWQALFNKLP